MLARARKRMSMKARERAICTWAKANVQQHCTVHTTHHQMPMEAVKRLPWLRGMHCHTDHAPSAAKMRPVVAVRRLVPV